MHYNELIEKQVIGRLRVDNPWWIPTIMLSLSLQGLQQLN